MDHYRVLGVEPDADQQAVRSSYRRLARQYHPDVATSRDAPRRFAEVREAYEVLSDPQKRRQYDRVLELAASRRTATSPSGSPGRGFRFALDLLGIRIAVGVGTGGHRASSLDPERKPRGSASANPRGG